MLLEWEEQDWLLAMCEEPLRTMVKVGTDCGLRLTIEALTLRWADVDFVPKTLMSLPPMPRVAKPHGITQLDYGAGAESAATDQ